MTTLLLALACTLGDAGPASPGSPAASLGAVEEILTEARAVEAMAIELEEAALAARELPEGPPRAEALASMRARMIELETRRQRIEAAMARLSEEQRAR